MIDKISLIRQILETDEETDIKILAILEKAKEKTKDTKILIEERLAQRKDIVAVILNYFEIDKNFLEHKFKRDNDVSVLVFNTLILYVKRSRG